MQLRCFRPPIDCVDADEYVFDARFGVLDEDVEVPVIIEHTRIDQLVLRG